ncbi:MAG: methyl-accepting chemotaxis protein [Bacteroidetes bacterium HGW-Bacteroidetes-17]|jgi:methyl-accepting chemotaxis protein|nr:MAG: methyl-accepting chemotaxis protein [Bacteroidetes bacterium HGW-Bacteroidetes-17]
MKNFENLTIRTKLLLSFGLIWIMLLAVIIIAISDISEIAKSEKKLNEVNSETAIQLINIRSDQNHNRADILEMIMTTKESDRLVIEKGMIDRAAKIDIAFDNLINLNKDPLFQNQLKEMKDNLDAYRDGRIDVMLLLKEGKVEEAIKLGTGIQGDRFEKVRSLTYSMADQALKDAKTQLALDQQQASTSILIFVIFGALALIVSFFMIIFLNNLVAKPLSNISIMATRIASGDLSAEVIANERKDEVGLLNLSFYQMVQKLRVSITEIMEGINLLGSSASEILAASTQVASGAAETASAISETTTTVEEVRQAVQLSSQKASRVSENSNQVVKVTQDGQNAVDATKMVMTDIQTQMESIANTIVRLSEHSQQIGGIIASVDDIADQSNLLAVNAAIEAAKAGEQGKGFAVVAQEIKNLSQQSKQSTIQVRTILSEVQKATTAAVMATEQGSKAVERGVKQSGQAGETIRVLAQNVNESVQAASQIVASSQQQVIGMDQVGLAMNNINQAGTENAASMKQAESAAKDLHELGQKLKHLVEQYKL